MKPPNVNESYMLTCVRFEVQCSQVEIIIATTTPDQQIFGHSYGIKNGAII